MLVLFGIDPVKTFHTLIGLPPYLRDLRLIRKQPHFRRNAFSFGKLYPCFEDRYVESGSAKGHYFHQDFLTSRRIYSNNPNTHVDIGSRIDGFVTHVASFRQIEVLDIRALSRSIPNVKFTQADLMSPLPDTLINYCDSLSSLHALEHFGLGRYGDPLNYDGYLLGLNNIHQILNKGGKLYLSVPIGPQRIEFNAHRVFSVGYLLDYFAGKYSLDQFSFVDDCGDLHENIPITETGLKNNFGCIFGCGIFEMTKL